LNVSDSRDPRLHRDRVPVHVQHGPLRGIEGFRLGDEFAVDGMDHHPIHRHGFPLWDADARERASLRRSGPREEIRFC
jgi:hypothetical protein